MENVRVDVGSAALQRQRAQPSKPIEIPETIFDPSKQKTYARGRFLGKVSWIRQSLASILLVCGIP